MSNVSTKILKLLALSILVVGCKSLYGNDSPYANTKEHNVNQNSQTDAQDSPDTKTLKNEAAVVRNATGQAHTVQQSVPYTVTK